MRRRQVLAASGAAFGGIALGNGLGVASPASDDFEYAVRSMEVERSRGRVEEPSHEVERDGSRVRVSGRVHGGSGCSAVAFGGVSGNRGKATVELVDVADGQVCTAAVTRVEYELVLEFDGRVPRRFEVDHKSVGDGADSPRADCLVRSFAVEGAAAGDESEPEVEIDESLDRATVTGVETGRNGCANLTLGGVDHEDGETTVTLDEYYAGQVCTQAIVRFDYELVLEYPDGAPRAVDVETVSTDPPSGK